MAMKKAHKAALADAANAACTKCQEGSMEPSENTKPADANILGRAARISAALSHAPNFLVSLLFYLLLWV